jgi:predicted acetyltransferase
MGFEIAVGGPDDFPAVTQPTIAAFGEERRSEEQLEDWRLAYDDMYLLGAREGERWVGTVADYAFGLTLPGGATVPAAGLTMVGVLPTHRRRGITTALMGRLLDEDAERGAAVSVLLAAEAAIYGRYGYGVATQYVNAEIDTDRSGFAVDVVDPGRLELVDHVEGSRVAEEVWEAHRSWRPGTIDRHWWMWEMHRRDREDGRGGASARYWVVHRDATGNPDGFACYRIKEDDRRGIAWHRAKVGDLAATTPEVEAILFRYLCDMDLVREIQLDIRPVDDHLRWRLTDPRQLQVMELGDYLWLRVLDLPAAFGARLYPVEDELIVEVEDSFRPASGGRFVIAGGPDGGACVRTNGPADLTLPTDALSSLLLGTVRASTLAEAGRIEASSAALARADAFFASSPAPFSCTEF